MLARCVLECCLKALFLHVSAHHMAAQMCSERPQRITSTQSYTIFDALAGMVRAPENCYLGTQGLSTAVFWLASLH